MGVISGYWRLLASTALNSGVVLTSQRKGFPEICCFENISTNFMTLSVTFIFLLSFLEISSIWVIDTGKSEPFKFSSTFRNFLKDLLFFNPSFWQWSYFFFHWKFCLPLICCCLGISMYSIKIYFVLFVIKIALKLHTIHELFIVLRRYWSNDFMKLFVIRMNVNVSCYC